jgi:hypothetical protein
MFCRLLVSVMIMIGGSWQGERNVGQLERFKAFLQGIVEILGLLCRTHGMVVVDPQMGRLGREERVCQGRSGKIPDIEDSLYWSSRSSGSTMSEYWVSKKKYFCKYCEIYIADDAPSRQHHENGLRHKGNLERFIRGIYKTGEKQKKDKEEETREMKRVERVTFYLINYTRRRYANTEAFCPGCRSRIRTGRPCRRR